MARLIPSLPMHGAFGAGGYAELALLQTLELGLSGAYTLFHSVDWSRVSSSLKFGATSFPGAVKKVFV